MSLAMLGSAMMASAGGTGSLGTLFVRLTADSTQLVRGMKQAEVAVAGGSRMMLSQLGMLATIGGVAMAALGAAGVRSYARFDEAMTKSTAIMGDMSGEMRKEMELTARSLALESTTSADKLAESYFFLASAGLSAEQSMAALATVNKFAIAGSFDMALATDLLTDAQSALGMTIRTDVVKNMENMVRVSDVLVKANTLANATVLQFSESLTNKGASALKMVNKELEEGVAVLAAWADQGIKGSLAGNWLNIVMRDLQRVSLASRTELDKLGITVFDANEEMRNMADIIEDLEKALLPMSVMQRRATFELLGFQDRSLSAILTLMGTSSAIRQYQNDLEDAGGTTQEVSDKQMQSFIGQLTITKNRVNDLLLSIGEGLTPALRTLNTDLQVTMEGADGLGEAFRSNAEIMGNALLFVVRSARFIFNGLMGFFRMTAIAAVVMAERIVEAYELIFNSLGKFIANALNQMVTGINRVVDLINQTSSLLPGFGHLINRTGGLGRIDFQTEFKPADMEEALTVLKIMREDLIADLVDQFSETGEVIQQSSEEAADGIKKIEEATKAATEAIRKIAEEDKAWLEERRIASEAANEAMNQMGIGTDGSVPGSFALSRYMDRGMVEAHQFLEERQMIEDHLKALEELSDQTVGLDEATNERRLQAQQEYQTKARALQEAQVQFALLTSSRMFEDIAYITEQFAGRQSGIYKAMFAASKAFAIAEAIIKIQQGIAGAASLTFPANLASMASVAAATASIVSNIQATRLVFAGEREKGGPVLSGKTYLVGEKGPELFTPKQSGTIIPNNRLPALEQSTSSVSNTNNDQRSESSLSSLVSSNQQFESSLVSNNQNQQIESSLISLASSIKNQQFESSLATLASHVNTSQQFESSLVSLPLYVGAFPSLGPLNHTSKSDKIAPIHKGNDFLSASSVFNTSNRFESSLASLVSNNQRYAEKHIASAVADTTNQRFESSLASTLANTNSNQQFESSLASLVSNNQITRLLKEGDQNATAFIEQSLIHLGEEKQPQLFASKPTKQPASNSRFESSLASLVSNNQQYAEKYVTSLVSNNESKQQFESSLASLVSSSQEYAERHIDSAMSNSNSNQRFESSLASLVSNNQRHAEKYVTSLVSNNDNSNQRFESSLASILSNSNSNANSNQQFESSLTSLVSNNQRYTEKHIASVIADNSNQQFESSLASLVSNNQQYAEKYVTSTIANNSNQRFESSLASLVSNNQRQIISEDLLTQLVFDGERATGGPVSSGKTYLVGEEGPELFSPNHAGFIVPNDQLGVSKPVRVVINNFTDARPEVNEREEGGEKIIEVMIRRVKNEIGTEIIDGTGNITKAMERSFGLRRGR